MHSQILEVTAQGGCRGSGGCWWGGREGREKGRDLLVQEVAGDLMMSTPWCSRASEAVSRAQYQGGPEVNAAFRSKAPEPLDWTVKRM